MIAPWAKRGGIGFEALDRVQASLTVDTIMTVCADLMTCRRDDSPDAVMARNKDHFSFLPVMDATECIEGLYKAEQWFDRKAPHEPIGDDFERLSDDLAIDVAVSILEFVETADQRPARLVVSGDQVVGLIHLSDLQHLPVRAALFTLMTSLEMAMASRIETEWQADAAGWLKLLSPKRRADVLEEIKDVKRQDAFVGEIVHTYLADKATIIWKKLLIPGTKSKLKSRFRDIGKLRDKIAHANYYAETPEAAREVSTVVRTILQIKADLLQGIEEKASTTN